MSDAPLTPPPQRNGVELSGYGGSVKAYGANSLWLLGFLIMAGAIVYDGWQERAAKTSQTDLLKALISNQTTFIEGVVDQAKHDHADIRAYCLGQVLDKAREGARDMLREKSGRP